MLSLVRAKASKRCGGALSIECDVYGVFIECIQCGATWTRNDINLTNTPNDETVRVVETKPLPPAITIK